MKSVIFLDQYASMGGGQHVLKGVVELFKSRGWHTALAAPAGGDVENKIKTDFFLPIPEPKLSVGKKSPVDYIQLLLNYFKSSGLLTFLKKHDIVYVNGPRLAPLIWMLSPFLKKESIVYHLHLEHSKLQKKFFIKALQSESTRAVIANSDYVLVNLINQDPTIEANPKLRLISNSLPASFKDVTFQFASHEPARVAVIGRISFEKGQDRVFNLAKEFPSNEFYFIGASDFSDPEYLKYMQDNSPTNVKWVGKIDGLEAYLKQSSIGVSVVPSRATESFGLVAVESMASSCYTMVSDAGQLKFIARDTGCPLFENDMELKAELKKVLSMNAKEREQRSREQFQATLENYPADRFINGMTEFIKELE